MQRHGVLATQPAGLQFQQLPLQRHRTFSLAGHHAQDGQVADRCQSVFVVLAKDLPAQRHQLFHVATGILHVTHGPLYRSQLIQDLHAGGIAFAHCRDQPCMQRLQILPGILAITLGGEGHGLCKFQLDPRAVVDRQCKRQRQCTRQQCFCRLQLCTTEQRKDLLLTCLQGIGMSFTQRAPTIVRDRAEVLRRLVAEPQGCLHPRHGLAQAIGKLRLSSEITRDRGFGTGQQVPVDKVACQISRTGPCQRFVEQRAACRLGYRDLPAQAVGHADAHGLDVDVFQHRLLERSDLAQFHAALFRNRTLFAGLHQSIEGHAQTSQQCTEHHTGGHQRATMATREFSPTVTPASGHCLHRASVQEALQVIGQFRGRCITPAAVMAHGLQHDPVKLATQYTAHALHAEPLRMRDLQRLARWQCRQLFRRPAQGGDRGGHRCFVQGRRTGTGEQFVQHDTQRIHIAARIDGGRIGASLLGTHVIRRACALNAVTGQGSRHCGGNTEIDDLRYRLAIHLIHQQVAGFEVTMDHTLVVGMLHAMADVDEQGDALVQRQRMFFAIARHRRAVDELHGEVRETFRRGTGIVDLGDGRMAHLRQQLALHFKVGQVTCIEALATQEFQGDGTPYRLQLFGTVDLSHATTTQQGVDAVTSYPGTGCQRVTRSSGPHPLPCRQHLGRIGILGRVVRAHAISPFDSRCMVTDARRGGGLWLHLATTRPP